MRSLLLVSVLLLSACSKSVSYDKRRVTAISIPSNITGPASGPTKIPGKVIAGSISDGLTISVHQNNTCSDPATVSGSSADFTAGLNYILNEGIRDIYLRVANTVESQCTGPYRNYVVDLTDPTISLDGSISASPTSSVLTYLVKGVVADANGIPTLSFHKNSACTDTALFGGTQNAYNSAGVTLDSTILNNLSVSLIYAKATDIANNSICQLLVSFTHVTGPAANDPYSYFTIEKPYISPILPVQTNEIKFFARDVNNNPVTGLSPVLLLTPVTSAQSLCTMVETAVLGTYLCIASISENYDVDIANGSITFMTDRSVGTVIVQDNVYCYENNALGWTDHKELGSGTLADPYLICTAAQLKSLADTATDADLALNYKLMNSLDLTTFLTPASNSFSIGGGATAFTGFFEGNSLKIENYKPKNSNQGFIDMMTSGTVQNLDFSYSTDAIATNGNMSPFIGIVSTTTGNVTLNNLNVTGSILCDTVNVCNVGGVVGQISASGSGQINLNKIDANITANNVSGSIGGVVRVASSSTASKIFLNEINSVFTLTHSAPANFGTIGGIVGTSIRATIQNAKSNMQVSISTAETQFLGGIVGSANATIVENTFVLGDSNIQNISGFGGILGASTNVTSVSNSVTLLNVNAADCLIECGKVIGQQNTLDNTYSGLYNSTQQVFNFDSLASVNNVGETSIDLSVPANSGYFNLASNPPMNAWNFTTVWEQIVNNFPELRFTNP